MRPILCLVTDRASSRMPLPDAVAAAVAGGVDRVQLRERGLETKALLQLARDVARAARAARNDVEVLANRRIDIALAARLDGVHLGFDAVPVATARALLPGDAIVGVATHAPDERGDADALDRPDYVHLAPIWTPISKPATRPPLGCQVLAAACSGAPWPVLAQGGVTPERVADSLAAGALGVAVTGEILGASDPGLAARAFREALDAE